MGRGRSGNMSDAANSNAKKKAQPDSDLLEFLGDIDEVNDENQDQDQDFSDFLANNDIDKLKDDAKKSAKAEKQPEKVKNE